jgi:adenosylhomocysteinase
VTLESVDGEVDIFTSPTETFDIITLKLRSAMKNNANLSNIGHVDNEIDITGLESSPGVKVGNIKPPGGRFAFSR